MKSLFRLSLVLAILLPLASFGFELFAFGGCVIPIVTPIVASISVYVLMLAIVLFPFVFIADLIAAIILWKRHGRRSFLPLVLIIISFLMTFPLNSLAHNLSHKRFERHLTQYEQVVSQIEHNFTSEKNYVIPSGWENLSYVPPIVYREDDGSLTIEFLVGGIGPPPRHIVYVYRSNGIIEEGSKTAKRWHHTTKEKERWFRASD
ncbi:MAG: hypothetical protein ABSB91_09670 [Sedimentisphaerales bacterium]